MVLSSNLLSDGFCHHSANPFAVSSDCGQGKQSRKGSQLFLARRVCRCRDGIVAAGRRFFVFLFLGRRTRRPKASAAITPMIAVLSSPIAPWKGAPFARRLRRGEAARGRAFADRARWTRRSQIA